MAPARTNSAILARRIASQLRARKHQAYFVGGCVRDLLLGTAPKDYDIATDAAPEQIQELFPGSTLAGAHFGVVMVHEAGASVEVATFRSDHDYADGRRPSHVRWQKEAREDVLRRDFTINALLLDPETGEVLDYIGGRADLETGIVRAIGDAEARFREDHLRMLRAIRFAARFNFEIESETEAAIVRLHPLIADVSAERVRDELLRILTEGAARRGFELLDRTELLGELLPEVAAMKGVEQPPEFHPEGDVWTHTLLMLEGLREPTHELAMGVLLHDVGKPPTYQESDRIRFNGHVEEGVRIATDICRRLRFSNDQTEQITALVENHMRFKDAPRMKESTLKRFLRLPHFDEHLELHRLDCVSSHGMLDNLQFVESKRGELGEEKISPPPLLTGRDLIGAGYKPSPRFGRVLQLVEDAQLEGRVTNKEEALALAVSEMEKDA